MAIALCKLKLLSHPLFLYIKIDCHFVWDAVQADFITASYFCSELPANILFKAFHPIQFHSLARKLGIFLSSYSNLRENIGQIF